MSLPTLNPKALAAMKALIENPADPVPDLLKALDPNGRWNVMTQKVSGVAATAGATEFQLPLFDASAATEGTLGGDWTWNASVSAKAALSIDVLTEEEEGLLPLRSDGSHTMVAYGAEIAFGGELGLGVKVPAWGSLKAGASGQRSASLRWYVQAKNDATLFDALDSARRHFAWPHDLRAMLRLADRTDWFGLDMALDGSAKLELAFDAGKSTGWTFGKGGEGSTVGLSFGVKAGFSTEHGSKWRLSAMVEPRRQENGEDVLGVRVKLHDDRSRTGRASLQLSAGADFSAAVASAERALRANWPELDSDLVDALVQPGTAVSGRIRELIDQNLDGGLKDLATVLTGGQPAADLRKAIVDKLTGHLADVLDGALGDISAGQAKVDELVTSWLARLLGSSAAAAQAGAGVRQLVTDALANATAGLTQGITDLKARIAGKAQAVVDAELAKLGELGDQFDQGLAQLDKNKVSAAIKKAVDRYAQLRQKLLSELADGQRAKLTLALGLEQVDRSASEALFEVWFRAGDTAAPAAERLYGALCGGRLLELPGLVAAAAEAGAIQGAAGWLLATRETLRTERATLNFFGMELGGQATWLRQVSIKADLITGNLLAARAGASVETAIHNPWKDRSTRLGLTLEVNVTDTGTALAVGMDGAFTARAEKTDRRKVQDLLDGYADAIGARRFDIGSVLPLPGHGGDAIGEADFWRDLTLAVPVRLTSAQWTQFQQKDAGDVERMALHDALAAFARRYKPDSLFSDDPVRDLREHIKAVSNFSAVNDGEILAYLRLFPARPVALGNVARAAEDVGITALNDNAFHPGSRRFRAFHRLAATVRAPVRVRELTLQAAAVCSALRRPVDPRAASQALDPLLEQMQLALAPVALVSETWTGVGWLGASDEGISWPFASFVVTMARLAGMDVPPGFAPVAQVRNGAPVRLVGPA